MYIITLKILQTGSYKFCILTSQHDTIYEYQSHISIFDQWRKRQKMCVTFACELFLCADETIKTCDTHVIDPLWNVRTRVYNEIMFGTKNNQSTVKVRSKYGQSTVKVQSEYSQKKTII